MPLDRTRICKTTDDLARARSICLQRLKGPGGSVLLRVWLVTGRVIPAACLAAFLGLSRDALKAVAVHDDQFPAPICTEYGAVYLVDELDFWRFRWTPLDLAEWANLWL